VTASATETPEGDRQPNHTRYNMEYIYGAYMKYMWSIYEIYMEHI